MKAVYCKIKRYNLTIKGKKEALIISQPSTYKQMLSLCETSYITG